MTDTPDNLVLALLRDIRGTQGEHTVALRELRERIGMLEAQYASLSQRLDRVGGDVEAVKRRLTIADAPAG